MTNEEIIAKNLDDAANTFAWSNFFNNQMKAASIRSFKAGAKWMAAQGDIFETEPYFCTEEGDAEVSVPTTFKPNEKVIVQIRKKEE